MLTMLTMLFTVPIIPNICTVMNITIKLNVGHVIDIILKLQDIK